MLITDIKTSSDAQRFKLINASKSMYSEAFLRYEPTIYRRIFLYLLETMNFLEVPEIKALGRLCCVDGSVFPAFASMVWANYKQTNKALKLHLVFEINRMIPVQFISTDANTSEKAILLQIIEAGVTYISDRGYVCFKLFATLSQKKAYFVIRGKKNIIYTIEESINVFIPESWLNLVSKVIDNKIRFDNDASGNFYRLICFEAQGEQFSLITNRFDLKTYQIIILYAYRWQVELFFRYVKRTFNGIHLMSHSPQGVEIQFCLHLIVYLLLLLLKQASIPVAERATIENTHASKKPQVFDTQTDNTQGVEVQSKPELIALPVPVDRTTDSIIDIERQSEPVTLPVPVSIERTTNNTQGVEREAKPYVEFVLKDKTALNTQGMECQAESKALPVLKDRTALNIQGLEPQSEPVVLPVPVSIKRTTNKTQSKAKPDASFVLKDKTALNTQGMERQAKFVALPVLKDRTALNTQDVERKAQPIAKPILRERTTNNTQGVERQSQPVTSPMPVSKNTTANHTQEVECQAEPATMSSEAISRDTMVENDLLHYPPVEPVPIFQNRTASQERSNSSKINRIDSVLQDDKAYENTSLENPRIFPAEHQGESVLESDLKAPCEPFFHLLSNPFSKPPACGIVSFLGEKLQKYWKIGIHWLTTVRNLLSQPYTPEMAHIIYSTP